MRRKLGFLLNGMKPNLFFWELTIFLRKFILILFVIMTSRQSAEVQTILAAMVLCTVFIIHMYFNPYRYDVVNKMEILSLTVILVTIFSGLFYITGQHYTYMNSGDDVVIFIFILIPNLLFYFYWLF